MSHFCVLVITKNQPTEDQLAAILQPWHEFECTGVDDQYVVDVDKTDEFRKDWETETSTMYRDGFGTLFSPYQDRFYREPTEEELEKHHPMGTGCGGGISWTSKDWGDGRGYRAKIHYVPDGFEEVEVPTKQVKTFREFCAYQTSEDREVTLGTGGTLDLDEDHKYGYTLLDAGGDVIRVIDRTNPNSKWDWYQVGGRYSARLKVFSATAAKKGKRSWANEQEDLGDGVDQARRDNLDFARMKTYQQNKRREWLAECLTRSGCTMEEADRAVVAFAKADAAWESIPGEDKPRLWDWLRASDDEEIKLALKSREKNFGVPEPAPGQTLEQWVEAAPAISCWAVVKDGIWSEKGEMGWFGMSNDKMTDAEWQAGVERMIVDLSPTDWLTFVDCHT